MALVNTLWLKACLLSLAITAVGAAAIDSACPVSTTSSTTTVAHSVTSVTSSTSSSQSSSKGSTVSWSAPPYVEPTGTPVQKRLTITWDQAAPNGVSRPVIKVNGHFPGPDLIFDEDDQVEVS